jgi:hypothetical protein
VEHPESLTEFNHISDGSNSTIVHLRMCSGFICDAVDLFNSVFSVHTLVTDSFYFLIFIYDTYYGVVDMMNVNNGRFGSVMWIMLTCTETVVNGAGCTVLIYVCSCTTVQVRRYTVVLF